MWKQSQKALHFCRSSKPYMDILGPESRHNFQTVTSKREQKMDWWMEIGIWTRTKSICYSKTVNAPVCSIRTACWMVKQLRKSPPHTSLWFRDCKGCSVSIGPFYSILNCHSRKITGVGSVLFKCPSKPWQCDREKACTIPGPCN